MNHSLQKDIQDSLLEINKKLETREGEKEEKFLSKEDLMSLFVIHLLREEFDLKK